MAGFLFGTSELVRLLGGAGVPVYSYSLTYPGTHSFTELWGLSPRGVCHGDDLFYLWDPVNKRRYEIAPTNEMIVLVQWSNRNHFICIPSPSISYGSEYKIA